ncbi:MAG: YitT family protein, partial [Alicyclobacillaceae bacterium]|nr:YitT family protein [Alicyclobacillaceae bacterium]
LLAGLYGGLILGAGLGLVFRGRASTGGTDLLARVLQVWTGRSAGTALLLVDGVILAIGGFVFGWERAMYALISLYVTSRTIDFVQEGWRQARVACIISEKYPEIQEAILRDLDRGVTRLYGEGGFSGADRPVLFCVVQQGEVSQLKHLVYRLDPKAFVVVGEAREVSGEGFAGRISRPRRETLP